MKLNDLPQTSTWTLARRAERMNPSVIREILKVTEKPGIISLAGGLPSPKTFPVSAFAAASAAVLANDGPGALQYAAPERLMGEAATWRSDLFSLGVIAYEMLTGRLPYGADAARVRTRAAARGLTYLAAGRDDRPIPGWIDAALRTAVHPDPGRRYEALSEFVTDLKTPNARFAAGAFAPLAERNPVRFWQAVSLVLALVALILLARLAG